MGSGLNIDRAFALLNQGDATSAWDILANIEQSDLSLLPRIQLGRAICLAEFGQAISAVWTCDQALAATVTLQLTADQTRSFSELRTRLLFELARTTNENWNAEREPCISVILSIAVPYSVRDFALTLRSLEVQKYRSLQIVLVGNVSTEQSNALQAAYPGLQFSFCNGEVSPASRVSNDLEPLRLGLNHAAGSYVAFIQHPVMYQPASLRTIAEIARTGAPIDWMTGTRFFIPPSLRTKSFRRPEIRWSEDYFWDQTRFRTPRSDLEFETLFFHRSFLSEHLSQVISQPKLCDETALFGRCFAQSAPHLITADLGGRIVRDNLEPEDSTKRTARKVLTLATLRRDKTPSSAVKPTIRLQRLDEQQKSIIELTQIAIPTDFGSLPKISVVVPTLNQCHLLRACLVSIVSQRYPNLELIVRDGGSSDGTHAVIEEFKAYIADYTSGPDAGHYAAVHSGLQAATGEILTWINSTDMLTPWSLRSAAATFCAHPHVAWLTGRVTLMTASGAIHESKNPARSSRALYLAGKFDTPWIQQEGTYFRSALWNKAGGSMDLTFDFAADLELWARFYRFEKLYTSSASLGIFRFHEGQRSEHGRHRYYQEALEIIERERQAVGWHQSRSIYGMCAPPPIADLRSRPLTGSESASLGSQIVVERTSQSASTEDPYTSGQVSTVSSLASTNGEH